MKILKKKKPKTKTWYKRELDRVFSIFIRQSYAVNGYCSCYTCGKEGEIREMQNGHFIPRDYMSTRWDEANCRVQCPGCNVFKSGNYTEYSYRLLKEIGEKGMDELMQKKRLIKQWTIKELEEMIAKYKELIK